MIGAGLLKIVTRVVIFLFLGVVGVLGASSDSRLDQRKGPEAGQVVRKYSGHITPPDASEDSILPSYKVFGAASNGVPLGAQPHLDSAQVGELQMSEVVFVLDSSTSPDGEFYLRVRTVVEHAEGWALIADLRQLVDGQGEPITVQ